MSGSKGSAAHLSKIIGDEGAKLLTARNADEFEKAFDAHLKHSIDCLEQSKKLFKSLSEDGLSSVLAGSIAAFGVTATRETNSNGHVDITIDVGICNPKRRVLCEAKIYDGPGYHIKGLEQLLNRYTTGREARGLLFVYVRKKNIAGLFKRVRKTMDAKLPLRQKGKTRENPNLNWSFTSTHRHSCGENLKVCHVGCNLCVL